MPTQSPTYDEIQKAVRSYCRDYIRAQRSRKRSYQDIADQLGVSHVWVIALEKDDGRGVGGRVEHHIAQVLHGGSVDQLRRAALNVHAGGLVIVEDRGQPVEIVPPSVNGKKPAKPAKSRAR